MEAKEEEEAELAAKMAKVQAKDNDAEDPEKQAETFFDIKDEI